MRVPSVLGPLVFSLLLFGFGCNSTAAPTSSAPTSASSSRATTNLQTTETTKTTTEIAGDAVAFFYQYVGPFQNGVGKNGNRWGFTTDNKTVTNSSDPVLTWEVNGSDKTSYGDPVFSRLSNGNWAMTAWTGKEDTRGAGMLLYHEAICPDVKAADVIALSASTASGCQKMQPVSVGKTSQIFAADGGNYIFHSSGGDVYLAHLSDAQHSATELDALCFLSTPESSVANLGYGETMKVVDGGDLFLSDTAMGKRTDGTWVLFAKGITLAQDCKAGQLCELCGRAIYRTTSTDLVHWSALEKVVTQASVPEAYTDVDGTVWLYWQDFSDACEANSQQLAAIAPISGAYELSGSYDLSDPIHTTFSDESFETNKKLHYATNGNPVTLPDAAAVAALQACAE